MPFFTLAGNLGDDEPLFSVIMAFYLQGVGLGSNVGTIANNTMLAYAKGQVI